MKSKIKILFFLAGSVIFLQSCAALPPTTTLSAAVTMDQKVGYGDTIVSQKRHFVSFTPYTQLDSAVSNIGLAKNKTKFILTVENFGNDPIEFSPNNISVVFVPKADDAMPQPIRVQPWQEFMEEFDREYDKNERKYIYTTLNGIYALTMFPPNLNAYEIGPGVEERLHDLVFEIESMRDQNDVLQEMLPSVLITQGRILSGNSYSGLLICDTSDLDAAIEGNFRISVTIDGEEHRFVFKRGLSK